MALIEVMEQDGLEGAYILAREVEVSLEPVLEKYGIQASVLTGDILEHLEDIDTDFVFIDSLEDLSEDVRKRVTDRVKELKEEGVTVFANGKEGMEELFDPDETVEPGEGIKD